MQLISTGLECIRCNPTIATTIGSLDGMSSILDLFHSVFLEDLSCYTDIAAGRLEIWQTSWQIDDTSRLLATRNHPNGRFPLYRFFSYSPYLANMIMCWLFLSLSVLKFVRCKNSSHLPKPIWRYCTLWCRLLMEEILHRLGLVVSPIPVFTVFFFPSQVVGLGISEASTVAIST